METVLIALSGGVDSSAAAALLQQQGYSCIGGMLQLCPGEDGAADAAAVARQLGIPFHLFDRRQLFAREVMDHFVAEYCAGRTPNPCIDCNRHLKFGALLEAALALGCRYMATGHYARVRFDSDSGRHLLLRGRDRKKDQSYMLYALNQWQLSHLLLPLGDYDKSQIRRMAESAGLCTAHKSDSQDICFIPDGDYPRFLQDYGRVKLSPGPFLNEEGQVLGQHRGLPCYTTGQRKGLGVSGGKPLYVIQKDPERNAILLGDESALFTRTVRGSQLNLISIPALESPVAVTAKTRYSQQEAPAVLYPEGSGVRVEFSVPQRAVTPGQAMVFYDGDIVVGGATITSAE